MVVDAQDDLAFFGVGVGGKHERWSVGGSFDQSGGDLGGGV